MKRSAVICFSILGATGLILIVVSMAGYGYFPPLIRSQVYKNLDLADTETEGYKNFVKPPVPVYMSFMMYNVDNPEEIVNNGSMPKLTEVGPFVYKETREKQNLNYSANDCSIRFGQYKRYDFDEERTKQVCPDCGRADERVVTMINAPYVGVMQLLQTAFDGGLSPMHLVQHISCAVETGKFNLFGKTPNYPNCSTVIDPTGHPQYLDTLFVKVTVHDFLFGGFNTGALQLMKHELVDIGLATDDMIPYVIQEKEDGELYFAALNTKSDTTHNEEYEIDTGKCQPYPDDNQWIVDPENNAADNEMINYMQIKQWGPYADRLEHHITETANCPARSDDPTCLDNDGGLGPYGDHGWWEQNNGHIDHIFHNITDNTTTVYHNNICNWPRGTDGQQFHPYVEKEETLWIFQTDICRSLFLRYQQDQTYQGFDTLKFVLPARALQVNTTLNLGFCKQIQPLVDWDNCAVEEIPNANPEDTILDISKCQANFSIASECMDGVQDITKCMEGAPVVISSPHFYQSPDKLREMFEGISDPNEDVGKYETYMNIEPYTGMVVSLHKRLQFNIPLHRDPNAAYFGNLWEEHSIFPMLWLEEFADLDEENKNKLDDMLTKPLRIVDAMQWTMFAVGVMLLLLVAILLVVNKIAN